eukprot:3477477-Pyramimonas_sp.AAC.1
MFLDPPNVLITKTMLLEHKPNVIEQDRLRQKWSKNISWKPPKVPRTFFGRAIGGPGRFATA